jgi:hypothetical protein
MLPLSGLLSFCFFMYQDSASLLALSIACMAR